MIEPSSVYRCFNIPTPSSLPSIISKNPHRTLCLFAVLDWGRTLQAPNEVEEHSLKKLNHLGLYP